MENKGYFPDDHSGSVSSVGTYRAIREKHHDPLNQYNEHGDTKNDSVQNTGLKNGSKKRRKMKMTNGDLKNGTVNASSTIDMKIETVNDGVLLSAAKLEKDIGKSSQDDTATDSLIDGGVVEQANGNPRLLVHRSVFTQKAFDDNYEAEPKPKTTFQQTVKKQLRQCSCSGYCWKDFIFKMFPFITIMKNYNIRTDLSSDIVSGLTVGIMHIPQGMAYGMLTTLPPVFGLYTSFFPVLIYFFFGTSKHISVGTFAVACLMVGSAVSKGWASHQASMPTVAAPSPMTLLNDTNLTLPFGGGSSGESGEDGPMSEEELEVRLGYAMAVAFCVGAIQLAMAVTRLGFVTVYLSDALVSGFTTGAACHVFTSQIKHVFGVTTKRYSGAFKLVYTYRDFFENIPMTNPITLITSILSMVILYCVSRFINANPKLKPKMFMPVPIELIVVVLGTVISYAVNLNGNYDVVIVDDIPTGLPVPQPNMFRYLGDVIGDSIALAIVIFAVSISMAKILGTKHDYDVDSNQELIAFGLANMVSSFFSATPSCASLSRSLIQEGVGGKTQVAGLVSCSLLLVVLLVLGPYFRTLPSCILAATIIVALIKFTDQVRQLPWLWRVNKIDFCVLAAIIIVALRGMFLQVLALPRLWRVSRIDFFTWIVAFLATVLLDVDLGLGVGVIFAIFTIVYRSQKPYACILGQIPGTDIYRDLRNYQEAKECDGIKIFRFDNSLFFVNAEHFRTNIYTLTLNPRDLKHAQKKQETKQLKQQALQDKENGKIRPDLNVNGSMEMEIDMDSVGNKETTIQVVASFTGPAPDFHTIILDCSCWSFIDSMGVKILKAVISDYKAVKISVKLANCKADLRQMFGKTDFYKSVDPSDIYISVHDAVLHSQHNSNTVSVREEQSSLGLEEGADQLLDDPENQQEKDTSA